MKEYKGGQWVKSGTYWDFRTGEFIAIRGKGGDLPAAEEKRYIRAPLGLVIIAGPFMGLLYIIFLPLLGIAGLTLFLAQRASRRIRAWWQAVSSVLFSHKMATHEDKKQGR